MPDKKLTDNEIVKALECCINWKREGDCEKCVAYHRPFFCTTELRKSALDLINRLQAENERLQGKIKIRELIINKLKTGSNAYIDLMSDSLGYLEIKAEAYKEFAEKILELFPKDKPNTVISRVTVKYILKELGCSVES